MDRTEHDLHIVRLMLEATRRGRIQWTDEPVCDGDSFIGNAGGEQILITFLHFFRTDEVGCDKYAVEISGFGIALDFVVGTEGFNMAVEMVAHSDPAWLAKIGDRSRALRAQAALMQLMGPLDFQGADRPVASKTKRRTRSQKIKQTQT